MEREREREREREEEEERGRNWGRICLAARVSLRPFLKVGETVPFDYTGWRPWS